MNTPWSSRPNRLSAVGDRPGRARYRAGAHVGAADGQRPHQHPQVHFGLVAGGRQILVLGGVLLFFVDSLSAGGMLGNILALLSGVSYAGVFMMNDMPDSDAISSVFWGDVISAVVGLPFLGYEAEFTPNVLAPLLPQGISLMHSPPILYSTAARNTHSVPL